MMRLDYSLRAVAALALVALWSGPSFGADCPPEVRAAAARVAALAELPGLEVDCEQLTRAELRRRLPEKLAEGLPVPLEQHLEALLRLGLVSGSSPGALRDAVVDFFAEQVLGYYEPEHHRMVLLGDAVGAREAELVLLHELAHAAQEVRHRLPSRVLALSGNADAQRAAAAIAEGGALLAMTALAAQEDEEVAPVVVAERAQQTVEALAGGPLEMPGVPRFVVAESVFPYLVGTEVAASALRAGGWRAVHRLERDPPTSTEQLLHPERRGDPPTEVTPDRLGAIGQWRVVYQDVLGEWGLRTWLEPVLGLEPAARAAAGWDGDLVRVARRAHKDGEVWRVDLVAEWDSPGEAREAARALRRALPSLLGRLGPGGAEVRVTRRGHVVRACGKGEPRDDLR